MEESDWMADWVWERESDGGDVKGVSSDVPAGLVVVSEVGVSSDIEREDQLKRKRVGLINREPGQMNVNSGGR
jgi:hypothetical protein